jgi:DNA-binding response OmpR family regulator
MNIKTLIVYEYQTLYEILTEIKEFLNFKILNTDKKNFEKLEFNKLGDYLILRSKNSVTLENSFVLNDLPIKLDKLIQIININFLKNNFAKKSEIKVGKYILDLNSRKIIFENQYINLTERETDLIIFIKSNNNVTIKELQNSVWGYSSELETHTVETHIYRLRKKMNEKFNDDKFIQNTEKGYKIL